jgi:hypothetical protein
MSGQIRFWVRGLQSDREGSVQRVASTAELDGGGAKVLVCDYMLIMTSTKEIPVHQHKTTLSPFLTKFHTTTQAILQEELPRKSVSG